MDEGYAQTLSIVAIAISGLTLVWTIVWSIYTHRRATRADLTVRGSISYPTYGPTIGNPCLDMTATNTGAVPVTLTGAKIKIRGKRQTVAPIGWVMQTPSALPIVLQTGGHWNGLVDLHAVTQALVRQYGVQVRRNWKLRPVVWDSSGREYQGDRWIEV